MAIPDHPIEHVNLQVQAYRWFTVRVSGRDCHTGTTDFINRSE